MFRISVSAVHTSALFAGVLIVLVFTGVGRAAPNPTCTVQVVAGQAIQAAIDAAPTGATVCVGPGTYQENLLIAKDGITLMGAGPGATVL
jgi:pectin methylesterase-like acyl-CoA thioesterase